MKTAAILTLVGLTALNDGSCSEQSADIKDHKAVEEQQEQYSISQPIPKFDYSLERDIVIQLYKARNERVSTWTVWRSNSGTIEGDCPSIGYPVPFDTSLTNPLTMLRGYNGRAVAVEQPEPNGIFASKNSTATWVRCVINGHESPIYIESKVTAYPYAVIVDYENNRVMKADKAKPSVVIEKKK